MKKTIILGGLILLLGSCAPQNNAGHPNAIDIAASLEHPTELKLSQLGKEIRYIPLETTDSSLLLFFVFESYCVCYLAAKNKELPVAILAVAMPCASGVTVMEVPFCRLMVAVPSSFIFTSSKLCPSATAFHVLFSLL